MTREPRPPAGTFADAGLPRRLLAALTRHGVTEPFPVQAAALPDVLAGENVLGRARTGAGKTLAYGLPTLARIAECGPPRPGHPTALVLVPTRELAQQVHDALLPYAQALRLRLRAVYGGTSIARQVESLRRGVNLVVATPGRLTDLLERRACSLEDIQVTVLDEADHMCDLGFLPAVQALLEATPADGQRLLFSATLDREVEVLVERFLPAPVLVAVDPEVSQAAALSRHALEAADRAGHMRLVAALAGGAKRTLVFARTQHSTDRLSEQLTRAGVPARPLHGGMTQNARTKALAGFADGTHRVLVATDVAARGIHVDGVDLVIHAALPNDPKTYQHRSGRTARAGASGADVLVHLPEERAKAQALLRAVGCDARTQRADADHPLVAQLAGPPAPRAEPAQLPSGVPAPRVPTEAAASRKATAAATATTTAATRRGTEPGRRGGGHRGAAGTGARRRQAWRHEMRDSQASRHEMRDS